jgi:hypothetical protein
MPNRRTGVCGCGPKLALVDGSLRCRKPGLALILAIVSVSPQAPAMTTTAVNTGYPAQRQVAKPAVPLDLQRWLQHFERNQRNRTEPDWAAPLNVAADVLPALRQSMREFQLGDGGGPASLIAYNAHSFTHRSDDLHRLVDAWFNEEKEHSRLLGCIVARLGGTRLESHWSFRLFCAVRWLFGVQFELQILTVTELTSTAYYTLLRRHYQDSALCDALALILRDEAGHVAFHLDRIAADLAGKSTARRTYHRWQFWLSGMAAATVLWASHHRCALGAGATHREFAREARRQIGRFLGRLDRRRTYP